MSAAVQGTHYLVALQQRLGAIAPHLLADPAPVDGDDPVATCEDLLRRLVESVTEVPTCDRIWLLLVGLTATFPTDDEVRAARRQLEIESVDGAAFWLLDQAYDAAVSNGSGAHRLRIVGGVVVDVDYTATHDLLTGIQRVVRTVVPRWHRDHDVELVVWTERASAFREPVPDERERVLHWRGPLRRPTLPPAQPVVVVPWRGTVVVPEVPRITQCRRLTSLAAHSPNRVVLVGYDCIPVVSAELVPIAEPTRFVQYLALVKHADVVAAISESAAREFRGFVDALPSQGLTGPEVTACPLASELLWREGLRFELRMLGSGGWTTMAFDRRVADLRRAGRTLTVEREMDDEYVWAAYRRARFTVFTSHHEGFGLPVAESLAAGTPVIAGSHGAVAETASGGGAVLVDPDDDGALVDAMRLLLTDAGALDDLRRAARARPTRTWDDYAAELWAIATRSR